jgi:RNA polymerase-binding transcription factor
MMAAKAKKAKNVDTKDDAYNDILKDLQQQRADLLAEAGIILGGGLAQAAENLADMGDQATAVADQNFMLRLREREQRLLKKIDEAIDRIRNSVFGVCEECGGEIGYKRLKARPVTTLCINCKTKQEEDEKSRE